MTDTTSHDVTEVEASHEDAQPELYPDSHQATFDSAVSFYRDQSWWDINRRDSTGRTLVFIAAENGWLSSVRRLVTKEGADVSVAKVATGPGDKNADASPLLVACRGEHLEVIKFLVLEADAEVNQPKITGATPLFIASQSGNTEVVQFLLDHGADLNIHTHYNASPLYIAAQNGHLPGDLLLTIALSSRSSPQSSSSCIRPALMFHAFGKGISQRCILQHRTATLRCVDSGNRQRSSVIDCEIFGRARCRSNVTATGKRQPAVHSLSKRPCSGVALLPTCMCLMFVLRSWITF